ncbi:hypothetical protein JCM1841_003142 [Sporobolomyces salmonicolor]
MSFFGGTSGAPSFSFGAPAASTATSTGAPAPSLFGSTTTAPGTGLFGAPPSAAPAAGGSSLFGQPPAGSTAPAPGAGGGLFGGGASASTAPKPAFSFGAPAAAASTGGGGGGLFGSMTAATPAAGAGAGMGTTGSLFGGGAGAGGGLFGAAKPAQPAGQAGGLFGASTTGQGAQAGGGGLFGASTAAAGTTGAPAFGASTAQSAAGSSTAITKNTKFQDLPDSARNVVEEIDNFIRQQSQLADELTKKNLGSEIVQTQRLYEQYSAEATSVTSLLQTDSRLLASLRAELEQTLADLHKTTALIEGYKNPQGPKAAEAKQVAGFPYEFFRRKAEEMRERVARYKGTMEQIASLVNSPAPALSPAAIAPTLKAQHASLVSLASAVSALDLELKALKDEYRAIWREKTGRGVDPFRINGAGAGGAKGLEVGMRGVEIR